MLRALYDFQAPYDGTLSFSENQEFLILKRANKDTNWVHVVNRDGQHGYIPANYVTTSENSTEDVLDFANQVLEVVENDDKLSAKDKAALAENLREVQTTCQKELRAKGCKLTYQLATVIRESTDCEFSDAVKASISALEFLQENCLREPHTLSWMLEADLRSVPAVNRLNTQDGDRLSSLVQVIMETADDREISVDEEDWKDLLHVVKQADSVLSVTLLERYDCAAVLRLIQHLQAETSWRKRKIISEILFKVLQLDNRFVRFAMNSVLPTELARDMQTHKDEVSRIHWSVQVLLIALCGDEPLSIPQREVFGEEFVLFLLELLEEEAAKEDEQNDTGIDLIQDLANIIFAINLQYRRFITDEQNPVISCLKKPLRVDPLIEKAILFFNREEDPLRTLGKFSEGDCTSVTHFMLALFSDPETGKVMYTSDLQVVLDVLLRQLKDLSPGENKRFYALNVLHAILQNSSYWETPYKLDDFSRSLTLISEEQTRLGVSDLSMQNDRVTILKIFHEFPRMFTLSSA